jgi:hypothetical protein
VLESGAVSARPAHRGLLRVGLKGLISARGADRAPDLVGLSQPSVKIVAGHVTALWARLLHFVNCIPARRLRFFVRQKVANLAGFVNSKFLLHLSNPLEDSFTCGHHVPASVVKIIQFVTQGIKLPAKHLNDSAVLLQGWRRQGRNLIEKIRGQLSLTPRRDRRDSPSCMKQQKLLEGGSALDENPLVWMSRFNTGWAIRAAKRSNTVLVSDCDEIHPPKSLAGVDDKRNGHLVLGVA